jgi:CTP synthase
MRFLFVTWGVISWIGKGIVAASIGKLLKQAGHRVTLIKLDPYLQIDAGTMSPYEHGEVFVTQDGYETDLDLWHYERFLNQSLSRTSSITSGYIFQRIITKERRGDYLGETVQVVPHVTNEIKDLLIQASADADVTIVEVGGTIGDIEGPHFIEAIRQLRKDVGREHTMYVHVAPLLYLDYSGEVKTKPIQHSVRELTRLGIQPDMIVCRTKVPLTPAIKEKISLFCDTEVQYVIEWKDAQSIYEVPQLLQDQAVDMLVQQRLWLEVHHADLTERNQRVAYFLHPKKTCNIGIIGKYAQLQDSYLSVIEALKHAWANYETKIHLHWIQAEAFEDKTQRPTLEYRTGWIGDSLMIWRERHGRKNPRNTIRERKQHTLLVIMSGTPDGSDRICEKCLRTTRRSYQRSRSSVWRSSH